MKNKGFTLIELLAVIVILAIIALIATPIILGIINDSRDSAAERSAELIISNVELAYSTAYMAKDGLFPTIAEVAAEFDMDDAEMDANGKISVTDEKVSCETTATAGGNLEVKCTVNGTDYTTPVSMTLGTK